MALTTDVARFLISARLGFPLRKPRAALGMARAFLEARLLRRPVLRGVDIVLTYGCNLRCSHCNISTMMRRDTPLLSLEDYASLERQLTRLRVHQVTFTGGEPLIASRFEEVVRTFRPAARVVILQTNGALIRTADYARWLRGIGVDIANFSLDSGIPGEHDANRGLADQYGQTLRAIALCREAGLEVVLGTVVSHQNIESEGFRRLVEFVTERRLSLILNLAVPTGRWQGNDGVMLTPQEQRRVRAMVSSNPYLRLDMDSTIGGYGCPAFREKLYVTPYGDVTGCTFVQVGFGNVREAALSDIRARALASGFMSEAADRCYAAEDPEFIERYISRLDGTLPMSHEELERRGLPGGR